jgi:hypothetical protein
MDICIPSQDAFLLEKEIVEAVIRDISENEDK